MQLKKNAYTYVCYVLFAVFVVFTFTDYFGFFGEVGDIDWTHTALVITVVLSAFVITCIACEIIARVKYRFIPVEAVNENNKITLMEKAIVAAIICAAAAIRVYLVFSADSSVFEVVKSQDIYRMAADSDGSIYEFLSLFPSKSGYVLLLVLIFKCFGASGFAVMMLNIVLSVTCILLTYLIARSFSGKIAGIAALVLTAFIPSGMLKCLETAPSLLYEMILLGVVLLFVKYFNRIVAGNDGNGIKYILISIIGLLTGLLGYVSSFSFIFAFCVFTVLMFREWKRAILFLLLAVITYQGTSVGLSVVYGHDLPIYIQEFGFDVMTNICDYDTLPYITANDAVTAVVNGESPSAIQSDALDIALTYLVEEPQNALLNLWNNMHLSNKDFVVYNSIVLSGISNEIVGYASDFDGILYIFVLFMSFIAIVFMYIFDRNSMQPYMLYISLVTAAAAFSGTISYELMPVRTGLIILTAYSIQKLYFNFVYGRIKGFEREKKEQLAVNDRLQELSGISKPLADETDETERIEAEEGFIEKAADLEKKYHDITKASEYVNFYMPMTEITAEPEPSSGQEPGSQNEQKTEPEQVKESEPETEQLPESKPEPEQLPKSEPESTDEDFNIFDILPVSKRVISYENEEEDKDYIIKKLDNQGKTAEMPEENGSVWERRRQRIQSRQKKE